LRSNKDRDSQVISLRRNGFQPFFYSFAVLFGFFEELGRLLKDLMHTDLKCPIVKDACSHCRVAEDSALELFYFPPMVRPP
jgi:hypothetical protein